MDILGIEVEILIQKILEAKVDSDMPGPHQVLSVHTGRCVISPECKRQSIHAIHIMHSIWVTDDCNFTLAVCF